MSRSTRERLRGAGSHWARSQKTYLQRLRSSCRRRSFHVEESVGSRAPPGGAAPAANPVLQSAVLVRAPPALRPVRAASPAAPRLWTRAVLGCAFLPERRRQRHRPRPLGPRRRTRRFAALPRRTEGGDRPGLRAADQAGPAPVQPCRLQPGAVARRDQELRCGRGPGLGLGGRRETTAQEQLIGRSAWGRLSPADGFAKASEIPAGKRLPPPRTCGGASRAGPASGVKATATALWAGRKHVPLEELRDDLELDDELLKTAMVGLINKDYADFVTFQQTWSAWTKPSTRPLPLWDSYEKRFCI
ncbi:uncharacterized protein [Manis javanica]|uniref:uncharacterized protein n=1 Tax=Manis javanica TaxID=9974 RepID=UPI003C6D00D8